VTTYLIPYRIGGKTRLGDPKLALAMLSDVTDAVNELAEEALVVDGPGGQGEAVAGTLAVRRGPVTILNADLPCVTSAEIEELTAAAPALVATSATSSRSTVPAVRRGSRSILVRSVWICRGCATTSIPGTTSRACGIESASTRTDT